MLTFAGKPLGALRRRCLTPLLIGDLFSMPFPQTRLPYTAMACELAGEFFDRKSCRCFASSIC